MFFIISFFAIFPLYIRRCLLYIIKDDSSEGRQNSSTNEGLILDQRNEKIKLINHLCCPFSTYYLDLYCYLYCNSKY